MICCSDPNCAEEAGLTLQRQIDPEAVPFCHPHGAQRQHELNQALVNFRVVVLPPDAPPTDLEIALARVAELETRGPDDGAGPELAGQLETALHTLEVQSKTLDRAKTDLAERNEAVASLRRELERTRAELSKAKDDLALCRLELERLQANEAAGSHVGPITPPPPTRPDRQ
jgi:septal ring factor EnvC (AmiA/AmiB activator)